MVWKWDGLMAETAFQKIGALICSIKFLFSEVAVYLYKSTIRSYMEYCCHVCADAPNCYLDMSDKLQIRACRTSGFSCAASLEPLALRGKVASLNLFWRYCSGRCSSELAEMVWPLYFRGRSSRYFHRFHNFSVSIHICYNDVYASSSFFPGTARLWSSLPAECLTRTNDVNFSKPRVNERLLSFSFI